ncbi:MAG: HlyD family secretion protein [Dysgonamonadaceae bacterium]|jgi:HlyD family secretion protein|nr:HlyD family secretion protein [Dysgonamonadaceae bacterium]
MTENKLNNRQADSSRARRIPYAANQPSSSGELELRSEEMHDILTRPPHILVRSGISVICGVIVLLIVGSFFFKYPDMVVGEIVVTTENPPVWMVAKASGRIKELNCTDKGEVKRGQMLAVIENPAFTDDVDRLKTGLTQCLITDSSLIFPPALLTSNYELGNLQNTFSSFLRTTTNYENFLSYNSTSKEKEALQLQINGHKHYSSALKKQLELKEEELSIARMAYEREKRLYEKKIISEAEMEAAENTFLNIRLSLQQLQTSMASNEIEHGQLIESVSKLDVQYMREKNSVLSELRTAYGELLSAIESWEQTYLLISPLDGTVTFNSFWKSNQFVTAGDKVLAVVPHHSGEIIGRIQSSSSGSGKIKSGQRVNIKVQGYPYMEYGTLQGRVRTISLIPNENNYSIEVELPQGLKTGTGKVLDFTGELNGQAEIITDDRSLFSRIFSPLQYLMSNHVGK